MIRRFCLLALNLAVLFTPPVFAQADTSASEIIVTAQRREGDGYDERVPLIGLRKLADYAVQEVTIIGDTREAAKRNSEVYAMIRGAIELAGKTGGIELATGEMVVEALTLANYRQLALAGDGRADTSSVSFLVKTRLSANIDAKAALERISQFVKTVPTVGRAEMHTTDDLTLSVVGPDQYRGQVIDLISADARATSARLGEGYAVEATGLDRPIEWSRASLTEVFLYLPYRYSVVPKGR